MLITGVFWTGVFDIIKYSSDSYTNQDSTSDLL